MGERKAANEYKLIVSYCEKTPEEAARQERATVALLTELKLKIMERQIEEKDSKRA